MFIKNVTANTGFRSKQDLEFSQSLKKKITIRISRKKNPWSKHAPCNTGILREHDLKWKKKKDKSMKKKSTLVRVFRLEI